MDKVRIGDRIRIIRMVGEPHYKDKEGTVEYIDSMGQIHGTWGGLAIQPERDIYKVVKRAERERIDCHTRYLKAFMRLFLECSVSNNYSALNARFTPKERAIYKTILSLKLTPEESRTITQ